MFIIALWYENKFFCTIKFLYFLLLVPGDHSQFLHHQTTPLQSCRRNKQNDTFVLAGPEISLNDFFFFALEIMISLLQLIISEYEWKNK